MKNLLKAPNIHWDADYQSQARKEDYLQKKPNIFDQLSGRTHMVVVSDITTKINNFGVVKDWFICVLFPFDPTDEKEELIRLGFENSKTYPNLIMEKPLSTFEISKFKENLSEYHIVSKENGRIYEEKETSFKSEFDLAKPILILKHEAIQEADIAVKELKKASKLSSSKLARNGSY